MRNYLHFFNLFTVNVFHLDTWGICLLANFGVEKQVPSLRVISFNRLNADFLSFAKNVPINNTQKHNLNNFRFVEQQEKEQ